MPNVKQQSGADGIREALDLALERDSSVFLIGEGVADPKGIFGTTSGLVEKYGPKRVVETPISENCFTGAAIGAAMMGRAGRGLSKRRLTPRPMDPIPRAFRKPKWVPSQAFPPVRHSHRGL